MKIVLLLSISLVFISTLAAKELGNEIMRNGQYAIRVFDETAGQNPRLAIALCRTDVPVCERLGNRSYLRSEIFNQAAIEESEVEDFQFGQDAGLILSARTLYQLWQTGRDLGYLTRPSIIKGLTALGFGATIVVLGIIKNRQKKQAIAMRRIFVPVTLQDAGTILDVARRIDASLKRIK